MHVADRRHAAPALRVCFAAGPGAPIPEHPFPGQKWREVRHDNTVTWLAYWRDTVNPKEFK